MYRKQVRRRRTALVLLVVACLVLISTHFSESEEGPLHSLQNGVGSALGPLEEGASRALKPVRDLVNWVDETFDARGENEQLRDEVRGLREDLAATEEQLVAGLASGEAARLTAESDLSLYEPVDVRVIGRSASTWTQTLSIDKGSTSGLEVDDAVISGDGLVGRVSALTGGSARVTLLTAADSNITAKVLKNGPQGIVTAEVGNPGQLIFELIESDKKVGTGDRLVTAGISSERLRSRFPAGIPIGEAEEERPAEQELRQQVHVRPYADMTRLDFVTVLTGGPA